MTGAGKPLPGAAAASLVAVLATLDGAAPDAIGRTGGPGQPAAAAEPAGALDD